MLSDALAVLASDADSQLRFLEKEGIPECIDELALDYDGIAAASGDMEEKGEIGKEQRNCVNQLLVFLKQMSGQENRHLWTPESLHSAREWKQVRSMAAECLALLR